ncbi:MAG: hypothetical protein ISP84_06245, partial [Candidatus Poseidonia sp.]|nr:hypothetical protein [Poseidonia sp.]
HLDGADLPQSVEVITDLDAAEGYDLAVLVTAHQACLSVDWGALQRRMRRSIVYDGRRVLDLEALEGMGWQAHAVGRPNA